MYLHTLIPLSLPTVLSCRKVKVCYCLSFSFDINQNITGNGVRQFETILKRNFIKNISFSVFGGRMRV